MVLEMSVRSITLRRTNMAWNERDASGYYFVCFRVGNKRFKRSLKTKSKSKADHLTARVEENLVDVERGRIVIPLEADLITFLLSDGRTIAPLSIPRQVTLTELFTEYFNAIPEGNLEESTIACMQIHRRQLERHFSPTFSLRSLSREDLQEYIGKRAKEVSPVTVKKAIVTFRTIWNWARGAKIVTEPFPSKGLKYPKTKEKPPFMPFAEVEELTKTLTAEQASEYWESVYLTVEDIEALLRHVENARLPFVYPMICFAAYTGARRSEIARARVVDVDLKKGWVTLHERKKAHDRKTIRRVPISDALHPVLSEWLSIHPGAEALFCHGSEVARSKKRSKTTGHVSKNRPKGLKARLATVTDRSKPPLGCLTRDEIHDHFKRALANSKWDKIRGWHTLRHSFVSCLASKGVDQRIIDEFVGHLSDEQRRRYRHLFPSVTKQAISYVFGQPSDRAVSPHS